MLTVQLFNRDNEHLPILNARVLNIPPFFTRSSRPTAEVSTPNGSKQHVLLDLEMTPEQAERMVIHLIDRYGIDSYRIKR